MYNVVEIFTSINGEGRSAGQLAVFVRFKGCNLDCSYCDTRWANCENTVSTPMTANEIYNIIKSESINRVTITGGEPLIQDGIIDFLTLLSKDESLSVEIETNGAVDVRDVINIGKNRPSLTMDYKLPSSLMEKHMIHENLNLIESTDTVKFVCGSEDDLNRAYEIITKYKLAKKCAVYLSPVFNNIHPCDMVEFMKDKNMNGVNLQLQLHKFIWDPNEKGV